MYKKILSSSKTINAGVTQESVLVPLLFLITVNDSEKNITICRLFAYNNSLQYSSNNTAEMECCINQDLNTLDMWSKSGYKSFIQTKSKQSFLLSKNHLTRLNCLSKYVSTHKPFDNWD